MGPNIKFKYNILNSIITTQGIVTCLSNLQDCKNNCFWKLNHKNNALIYKNNVLNFIQVKKNELIYA